MRHLLAAAGQLGYQVHVAHIDDDPELLGYTAHDERIIVVRLGMTLAQTRFVLAHEVGHAYYGHTCDSETNENQADAYAASILIPAEDYADLERINPDAHYIADELGVAVDAIHAFRKHCLVRLGTAAYSHARMGARQWALRSAHA